MPQFITDTSRAWQELLKRVERLEQCDPIALGRMKSKRVDLSTRREKKQTVRNGASLKQEA